MQNLKKFYVCVIYVFLTLMYFVSLKDIENIKFIRRGKKQRRSGKAGQALLVIEKTMLVSFVIWFIR